MGIFASFSKRSLSYSTTAFWYSGFVFGYFLIVRLHKIEWIRFVPLGQLGWVNRPVVLANTPKFPRSTIFGL